MYNLSNPTVIKNLLDENGFSFKKSLGQNFLISPSVCPQMADAACSDDDFGVIEIGPGIGVLTVELAKRAQKVVAIELDDRLRPVLSKTLGEFDNVEVIFEDAMKLDLHDIIATKFAGMKVCVCANLPYYITSPIVMMLLESKLPVETITVMVQKEAADRLCAKIGSREAGAVSVAVRYYSNPQMLFTVSRGSFLPAPKVDSAVIQLSVLKEPGVTVNNETNFFKFFKAGFSQRRKTLVNSVSSMLSIDKPTIISALEQCGLSTDVRTEKLTMEQLSAVSNLIFKL